MQYVPAGIARSTEATCVPIKITRPTRTKATAVTINTLIPMKKIAILLQFVIRQRDWKGHLKSSKDYTTGRSTTNAWNDRYNSSMGTQ